MNKLLLLTSLIIGYSLNGMDHAWEANCQERLINRLSYYNKECNNILVSPDLSPIDKKIFLVHLKDNIETGTGLNLNDFIPLKTDPKEYVLQISYQQLNHLMQVEDLQ